MRWTMAEDRDLMKLAKADQNAEMIAAKMDRSYATVVRAAKRLGLRLAPSPPRPNRRFKAKTK